MMKIRLALVAACLLVHLFGQADKLGIEGNTILVQYLCLGQTVRLQTLTDLESLSAERCRDPVIKNALDDLKEMVRELRICTMDKAKKITSFYETYLSKRKPAIATDPVNEAQLLKETPPTPDQSEFRDESPDDLFSDSSNKNNDEIAQGPSSRLPDELVDFAIAYGMKVSGKCREYLFFTLKYLTKIGLGRGDFMALNEWTNNKSPVARILAPITKHGDFLLPSDFSAHLPSMEEHYKITVEPKNLNNLKVAQWVCINRFRPLYEPIVMPIAHLARHGLTYNLYRMRKELALSWGTRRLLTKWSRIVFVCEYMKNANFGLDDKINAVKYFDTTPDFITVRPEERHEPGLMFLEETVLAPSERGKLHSAIAKYDASLSEAERFRKRLISNRWKLLMSAFESKEKWQTLIDGAISMYKRDRSDSNMSEELKLAINNLEKTAGEGKKSRVISILFKLYQVGDATIRGVGCLFDNLIYIILTEIIKTFPDADRRATTF